MTKPPHRDRRDVLRQLMFAAAVPALLPGCGGGGGGDAPAPSPTPTPSPTPAPTPAPVPQGVAWGGFARDAQHTAVAPAPTQDLGRIAWSTAVDLQPQYQSNGSLLAHYGSPVISAANTVVVPVKTGAAGGFRVEARAGSTGALLWSADSDYRLPPASWLPAFNPALAANGRLWFPGAGGTLWFRDGVDGASGAPQRAVFYGSAAYAANGPAFDASVCVNTPLTVDAAGNVFFGFVVTGSNPANLLGGGIARIGADGTGSWVPATTASGDASFTKAAMNSAPALSPDGRTLYVALNTLQATGVLQSGALVALDATTLAVKARVTLREPIANALARVNDNGTSSPAVGPDGRVFLGVLEPQFGQHNGRGWLLQFDAALNPVGAPGSFGWDVTPTVIPSSLVNGGAAGAYLLALKSNNYLGAGTGDGQNRLAVMDPFATQKDAFSSVTVMRELQTIVGPTAQAGGGVYEWCINTMAADVTRRCVLVNSEDGLLYRWDLPGNTLTQSIRLTAGLGQAYTPTLAGPDGTVYAISNARLFAVRA